MRAQLVIGNKTYSSWSLRPWLAARHAGIDFEEVPVRLGTAEGAARIAELSPSGKVPVWREGGLVVWESLAICERLAELAPTLWPADSRARAVARAVSTEMHAGFPAIRSTLCMNARASGRRVTLTPEVEAEIARIEAIWGDCRARFGVDGPWLFGPFSIADAMFAPFAFRFPPYGISRPGVVDDYLATLRADVHVRAWADAAAHEPDVIEAFECGR